MGQNAGYGFQFGAGRGGTGIFIPESASALIPFADNAARDVWGAANLSDLVRDGTVVSVTGVPDTWYLWRGETEPPSYDNTNWETYTDVVRGAQGIQGIQGIQGPAGNPFADNDITANLTINTANIATYRNQNVLNTSTVAGDITVTLDTIANFLAATPDDEFVLQFINDSNVGDMIIAASGSDVFGQILGNITLNPGQALRVKLPDAGTRWLILSASTSAIAGTTPLRPTQIPEGNVALAGTWDASTGTFPAGAKQGDLYEISVSGTVDSIQFNAGDFLIALVVSPSTTVFAGNWQTIDGSDSVHSWAGMTGVITDAEITGALNRLGYSRNRNPQWNFSTSIDSSDPGAGNVAINNALKENATTLTFNLMSAVGSASFDEVLENLRIGDRIFLQSANTAANYVLYAIEANPVIGATDIDISVVSERSGGSEFLAADPLNVDLFFTHAATVGPSVPSLHNFSISIASRVDLNTDLNVQQTVTFDVSNHSQLTALNLIVTTGTDQVLTVPTTDGIQSQTVTLAGIDTSGAGSVTFQLSGTHTGGTVTSNIVTVTIANVASNEQAYYGVLDSAADFTSVDVGTLTAVDVTNSGTVYDISQSIADTRVFGILSPDNRDPVSILNTVSNQPALSSFTPALAVRVIDTRTYNLLTTVNNSGFTGALNYRVTTE